MAPFGSAAVDRRPLSITRTLLSDFPCTPRPLV
jgi:hypothetical protein